MTASALMSRAPVKRTLGLHLASPASDDATGQRCMLDGLSLAFGQGA